MSRPKRRLETGDMTSIRPDTLTSRLAEAERAATPDRRPDRRDWLVLAMTAILAPVVMLLIGWAIR